MKINDMCINQLKGRLTDDPEFKETKNGKKLLSFTLAYNTPQVTDSEGSHANFIQVEAWEKVAEIFEPLLTKGLEVLVHGNLVQKRWKAEDGSPRSRFIFSAGSISVTDLRFRNQAA